MGDDQSVRFELRRSGAPVYIDQVERIALNSVVGRFTVPGAAQAVLEVEVDGALISELGAIALDDEVWLSNPITGNFEPLPPGYDIDPSLFFDPKNGWRPLMDGPHRRRARRDGTPTAATRYHIGPRHPPTGSRSSPQVSSATRTSTSTSGSSR